LLHDPGGEAIEGKFLLYAVGLAAYRLGQFEDAGAQRLIAHQGLQQPVGPHCPLARCIGKQRGEFVGRNVEHGVVEAGVVTGMAVVNIPGIELDDAACRAGMGTAVAKEVLPSGQSHPEGVLLVGVTVVAKLGHVDPQRSQARQVLTVCEYELVFLRHLSLLYQTAPLI